MCLPTRFSYCVHSRTSLNHFHFNIIAATDYINLNKYYNIKPTMWLIKLYSIFFFPSLPFQDYLGGVIVFVAIITALLTARLYPANATPSLVGLAINYTLLVPIYLNWVVKLLSDMEMYVGAVERIAQYIEGPDLEHGRPTGCIRPNCEYLPIIYINPRLE